MKTLLGVFLFACALPAQKSESVDESANSRIRQEATGHSQVMSTLHVLTDRYGPRLTGSPNFEGAARWVAATLTSYGLKNAHLEPWSFGHPGWLNERAAGYLVSPVEDNLTFEVLAWTPSTKGQALGAAVQLIPPTTPTKDELTAWLAENQDKVRGKIVLLGKAALVPVNFDPPRLRQDDAQVKARYNGDGSQPAGRGGGGRGPVDPTKLTANQMNELIDPWLVANGALVRINDAAREHGQIRAFNNRTFDVDKAVPTVVLRNEDFGRIERLLKDGSEVRLEFNIVNHVYPEGKTSYNVVAEIPGSTNPEEVVMLGAHLDSWHSATGATDNAIGSTMMMEAVRIIQTLGLKPRRTIRIALWSGEEEGLLGSIAYVKEHFGSYEDPKPEFSKLVGYVNVDSGTGRLRGASIFEPPEAAAALRQALAPFEDLGFVGALPSKARISGGTDSSTFNVAGLAGIGMQQDPIEYQSHTWHTNLDTYERIVPEDAIKATIVVAATVWHLANRSEMLPRFTKEQMPAPGSGGPTPAPPVATPAKQ
jgi:carboxypeptidase Q